MTYPRVRPGFRQEVKKSRFIGVATRVGSVDDARAKLSSLRREFPDATHHCSAYVIGDPSSTSELHADDDGEPSGTAGRPILNVLQHRRLGDVLVVVVRYFGGIKLGAGGLVRAYSSTASAVVDALDVESSTPFREGVLRMDYSDEPSISRRLEELGVNVSAREYGVRVELRVSVPEHDWEHVSKEVSERSSGRVTLEPSL